MTSCCRFQCGTSAGMLCDTFGQQGIGMNADLDRQRALHALQRGWVTREQIAECMRGLSSDGLIVAELHRRGFLDTLQVQQIYSGAVSLDESPPPQVDGYAETQRSPEFYHRLENLVRETEVLIEGDMIACRYRIQRLFKGGCGRVYLCADAVSGLNVALKTLLRAYRLRTVRIEEVKSDQAGSGTGDPG